MLGWTSVPSGTLTKEDKCFAFLLCWLTSGLGQVDLKLEITCPNFSTVNFWRGGVLPLSNDLFHLLY